MDDAPTSDRESGVERADARAGELGFRVGPGARQLTRDLRDALIGLASEEYRASDCAGPIARPIIESIVWLAFGGAAWLIIALIK